MPKGLPRQSEKALQASIVTWLRLAVPDARVFQFGAAGTHAALRGAVPTGWPDLLVIAPGPRYIHIEVKRPGQGVTVTQGELISDLMARGCNVHVASSVAGVAGILREHGVTLRCEP